jgi:hypothetical protein
MCGSEKIAYSRGRGRGLGSISVARVVNGYVASGIFYRMTKIHNELGCVFGDILDQKAYVLLFIQVSNVTILATALGSLNTRHFDPRKWFHLLPLRSI